MIQANISEIVGVLKPLRIEGDQSNPSFKGVSIDSRSVSRGNLFIAIVGKNTDGHKYIPDALKRGVPAIIVNDRYEVPEEYSSTVFIVVSDTFKALHELASWWLSKFNLTKIAVTGTNGKTTTKEMIAAVLSTRYRTYRSPGNFNNLYGIPLAVFGMDDSYEAAVLEFGMSTPGEIEQLTRLVQPQYGVITNIDAAHLETMLTVDAIAKAKFELLDNMPGDGTAILNLDNKYLRERFNTEKLAKLGFGVKEEGGITPSRFESNGSGCAKFHLDFTGEVHLATPGIHNMYNALAAIAVGQLMSIPGDLMKTALESFRPVEMRTETIEVANVLIVNDTYNANPASMRSALETFASIKVSGRKIAVLGDMLELGDNTEHLHREIGAFAASMNLDTLIVSGTLARNIAEGAAESGYPTDRLHLLDDVKEVIDHLLEYLQPGDALLVKASRSMGFDRITIGLRSQLGRSN